MTLNNVGPKRPLRELAKDIFTGLVFDYFGIFAGLILLLITGTFQSAPWILVLFPGILSARGLLGGILSARLTTGLHMGVYKSGIQKNTRFFYNLIFTLALLMFLISLLIGGVACGFELLTNLQGFPGSATSFPELMGRLVVILEVTISTLGISFFSVLPLTITFAGKSFEKGIDPDLVTYPVASTTSDSMSSLVFFFVVTLALSPFGTLPLAFITLSILLTVVFIGVKQRKTQEIWKELRALLPIAVTMSILVNLTGQMFKNLTSRIASNPVLFVIYPALLSEIGDAGAIIGSSSTSKFATGEIPTNIQAILKQKRVIGITILIVIFNAMGFVVIGQLISPVPPITLASVILGLLFSVSTAAFFIILVAIGSALLAYKLGYDPDNFMIPMETATADLFLTFLLLLFL
jgi:cation transporter-like permease